MLWNSDSSIMRQREEKTRIRAFFRLGDFFLFVLVFLRACVLIFGFLLSSAPAPTSASERFIGHLSPSSHTNICKLARLSQKSIKRKVSSEPYPVCRRVNNSLQEWRNNRSPLGVTVYILYSVVSLLHAACSQLPQLQSVTGCMAWVHCNPLSGRGCIQEN